MYTWKLQNIPLLDDMISGERLQKDHLEGTQKE